MRAHTVRRSADLRAIAREGHVYHPESDIALLNQTGGGVPARLIGINEASTFWGFCQGHDSAIFSALETQPLVPTPEQAFLLAYWPLVKELYLKERLLESLDILRQSDKGRPLPRQLATQQFVHDTLLGVTSSILDLRQQKAMYDRDLLAGNFDAIRFVAIHLAGPPDIVCSGVVQPSFSFSGTKIQDLTSDEVLHDVAFSLLANDSEGAAIFSWRSDADSACTPLVDSLVQLPVVDIPAALVRFALSEFENCFFRPEWWESLSPDVATALSARFMHGVDPRHGIGPRDLTDDGVRPVSWSVRGIQQKRC